MATKIPDVLERRHLVERELKPEQALRYAEAYLEAGREQDAIEFLAKAGATERLAELRARAIEAGDAFLFRSVAVAMDTAPEPEEWRALSEAAAAAGKQRYADDASGMAERGED